MFKKLFFLAAFAALASCSDDDSSTQSSVNNPLPLTQGNYWVYDVQSNAINGRDSLYVYSEANINGTTHKTFKTQNFPFGLYSNALNNSAVIQSGSQLFLTALLSPDVAGLPINLDINGFVIFDGNAQNGTQLSQTEDAFNQVIEGMTIQGTYTFTSFAGENLSSYTIPSGETYNNVKSTVLKLNLTISVSMPGFPITYTVLPAQDVITATHYYADGVGMIYAVTDVEYELADTFGFEIPLPQSMAEHQEEILIDYSVQP